MNKRFKELDSLRGLEALSVVAYHYLISSELFATSTPNNSYAWIINILKNTPLHIIWAGPEAVVFFFVLSGFVLSLQFYSKKKVNYRSFLLSRFCRIYLPSYAALLAAITLDIALSRHGIKGLSGWFNSIWTESITPGLFINNLLLIRYFGYGQYNSTWI